MRLIEPFLDVYAILTDDGAVVTVGHIQKRIGKD
jgi:hypothetical protein